MKNDAYFNPVRKIPKNYTSLTGKISSNFDNRAIGFESSLERDFIKITNFNQHVEKFVEQPVTIIYKDNKGTERRYTPDFLIFYKSQIKKEDNLSPNLVEIKYENDLKLNYDKYKSKFLAARTYCEEKGWVFSVITDLDIRNDYLYNVNFLSRYSDIKKVNQTDVIMILGKLNSVKESCALEIINELARDQKRRGIILYTLWYLLSTNNIHSDLSERLTMKSKIWA